MKYVRPTTNCTTWTCIYEPHLLKMVHLSLDSGYLLHCSCFFPPFFFIQPTLVAFLRTSQDCRSLWTRFSFFPSSNVQTCFFCERKIKLIRMIFHGNRISFLAFRRNNSHRIIIKRMTLHFSFSHGKKINFPRGICSVIR